MFPNLSRMMKELSVNNSIRDHGIFPDYFGLADDRGKLKIPREKADDLALTILFHNLNYTKLTRTHHRVMIEGAARPRSNVLRPEGECEKLARVHMHTYPQANSVDQ